MLPFSYYVFAEETSQMKSCLQICFYTTIVFTLVEVMQIKLQGIKVYFSSFWNMIDLLLYISFYTLYAYKNSQKSMNVK